MAPVGTVGFFGLPLQAAFLCVAGSMLLAVAGPLTSVLLGGIEKAVAGLAESGLLSWLAPLGFSEEELRKYEKSVKAGKILVIAQGSLRKVRKAWRMLKKTGPTELDLNVGA